MQNFDSPRKHSRKSCIAELEPNNQKREREYRGGKRTQKKRGKEARDIQVLEEETGRE